ncbi:replication-relaxation family protein [Sporosarcina luteola]|uniref:replication-relaxation family protein n=1 Tax=Sporosarcina luteola TaxID=582850 RepID=UPI00203BD8DB|nr:replication-relaxation family protein [Sporosarcina luteola]MCM3636365.1 replication-relaxation family protein [Sporosarcina luteola]
MAYVFGYSLTAKTERILKLLISYRGMTARQMAHIYFGTHQINLSQEKSIYNDLAKLKKQGLVKSMRLQQNVSKGSLYYLTPSGYDCTKDLLNIHQGQSGFGWMPSDFGDYDVADLSYELYQPPLKQVAHHLMLIDFFIQLYAASDDLFEVIPHRHNLYAAKKYNTAEGIQQYRPDAEISIDGKLYTVEIDRATESHEQLLQKFITYRRYFDAHVNKKNEELPVGILFVVESRRRDQGIRRRWHNILSAFYKALSPYSQQVNLIMTTMDQVSSTLHLEQKRSFYRKQITKHLKSYLTENQEAYFLGSEVQKNPLVACVRDSQSQYRILFCEIVQEFESSIYSKFTQFQNNELQTYISRNPISKWQGSKYLDYRCVLFYPQAKPVIIDSFSSYKVDPQLDYSLSLLSRNLDFHSFNPLLNLRVSY